VTTSTLSRDQTTGEVVVLVTVENTGTAAATSVLLTTATIGSTSGTPLPQSLGTIPVGGSAAATVRFPAAVGSPGQSRKLTLGGTFDGGTFSSARRISLP
jgi:hypothetical protein